MRPLCRHLPIMLVLLFGPAIQATAQPPVPLVRLENDRLTLHARDMQLSAILGQLAGHGLRIRIDPRIDPKVTARFDRRPIGTALASILKSVDYALIWRKDKAAVGSEPKLWEIRIFYKGQERRIQPLPKKKNLAIVQRADGVWLVKDILLLRLTPQMTEVTLAALLDRLGATLVDGYAPLGIVRIRLPHGSDVDAIASSLVGTPGVDSAEPDYAYRLGGGAPIVGEGGAPPSADSVYPAAEDTVVAVMDSGLSADYADRPYIRGTFDAVSPGAELADALGHGTQMSLIAAGAITPFGAGTQTTGGTPVVAIRAFDDNGFTSTYTMIRAIDYAAENGARVVSLSWGSETSSDLLASAVDYASARGLVLVAAAGNEPTGEPVYPAAYEKVIGVGALTADGKDWEQSNHGDFVSIAAPGVADLPVGYNGDPGRYAGTSIATAFTARRIAAILDDTPDADRDTILKALQATP